MKSNRIYRLGNHLILIYLAFLSAFAPLSTDMYLPALPLMAETYGIGNGEISLTISLFLLFFGVSMLIWGPLSDRYGRRPILLAGSVIFIAASVIIALSGSAITLYVWRCVEACGAGAVSCISLAIVKDLLRGKKLEKILGILQAATILAPMIAPVLGGGVLLLVSWRGIFWILAFCGLIAFLGALPLKETALKRADGALSETFRRIGVVLKDRRFRNALLLFSMSTMPFFSFLAVSAFIYQNQFGQSPQIYSLFFAFNAFSTLCGPMAHLGYLGKKDRARVILAEFAIMTIAGACIIFLGSLNMWFFALLFALISFCGSAMRPPSTVLIMECIPRDNGIVASLINFGHVLLGSLAMFLAAFSFWPKPVLAVGTIACTISGICWIWWARIRKEY